jgi:hypothetical protein
VVGIAPLAAWTYLATRGIYRVAVSVLNVGGQPVKNDLEVSSSVGGEKKMTEYGWEIDIPVQAKPIDGKVTIRAEVPSAFLAGASNVTLDKDYYPYAVIHLAKEPSVTIRGDVVDEHQRAVSGANVALPECSQSTQTDAQGLFALNSCVAEGQMVKIRAEKGRLSVSVTVIAGQTAELMLRNEH